MGRPVLDYQAPAVPSQHSRAGIASALLAPAAFCASALYSATWEVVGQLDSGGATERSETSLAAALAAVLCLAVGLICGVVGIRQRRRKRFWAIAGLLLNLIALIVAALTTP
jgi:hypothetical protein